MSAPTQTEGGALAYRMHRPRRTLSFAVIICAYTERRWDDLVSAVASVELQSLRAAEIVLVIDHAPSLLERARSEFPHIHVLANEESKGLSGARNTGVKATRSDIVTFLDDDAVADNRWLETLASAYDDALVLGVGGTVEPNWTGERPMWFPEEFDWVVGCSYLGQPRQKSLVRNLIGCNMSFRREVLTEIGGFRRELGRVDAVPNGCEETELCIRATQRYPFGRIVLEPAALVHHRVTSERATWRYFQSRCRAEGRSKAILCGAVGDSSGLSSERTYTTKVLPIGVLRSLLGRQAKGRRQRALAIIAGFALVTSGYVQGRLAARGDAGQDG